jgi:hypothetical protein
MLMHPIVWQVAKLLKTIDGMLYVLKERTFMAKEEEYDENFSHTIECAW